MIPFLSHIQLRLSHISDDTLATLVSGELGSLRAMRVNAHLNRCWQCRTRRDELENAAKLVVHYRNGNLASCMPLDPRPRQNFLAQLNSVIPEARPARHWLRTIRLLRVHLLDMNPVFASAVVVCLASFLLLWIWQRSATTVSAGEILRRAELSDLETSKHDPPGVLYQQVAIRAGKTSVRHTIYRDLAGKRKPRATALSKSEGDIERKLEAAGVNWQQPLSASDYRAWHERQSGFRDEVRRTGHSELTLTTSLENGDVSEESLTVRESDFHPVRRTVELRGEETIEVAELDFAVLGWNAVNGDLFEPLAVTGAAAPISPSLHAVLPHALPTPMQIDAAELDVRIALNQLRADKQDQIRIADTDTGVLIKGIVGTNERKRELVARLDQIPFAHAQILSTEEVQAHPNAFRSVGSRQSGAEPLQVYSASAEVSPLARLIEDRRLDRDLQNTVSRHLVEASLRIGQAGLQLVDLERRFPTVAAMTPESQNRYSNLSAAYKEDVLKGLEDERAILAQIDLIRPAQEASNRLSLERAIEENQRLCQELIVGSTGDARPASAIATDILTSANQIITALNASPPSSPKP